MRFFFVLLSALIRFFSSCIRQVWRIENAFFLRPLICPRSHFLLLHPPSLADNKNYGSRCITPQNVLRGVFFASILAYIEKKQYLCSRKGYKKPFLLVPTAYNVEINRASVRDTYKNK
jgi:hypothetical protein